MVRQIATLLAVMALASTLPSRQRADTNLIGTLRSGAQFISFRSNGIKGVAVIAGGSASAEQNKPVQLEFYGGSGPIEDKSPAMKHSGSQGRRRMVSLMSMDLPDHDSTSRMNGLSRETRLSCREGLRSQGQARAVFCLRLRSLIRKRTPDLRWTILLQV